jgi:hypothetical protein
LSGNGQIDVACGNNKVSICTAGVTSCQPTSSVSNKLRDGATLGACVAMITNRTTEAVQEQTSNFALKAYPNPTTSGFTIVAESNNAKDKIAVRVLDLYGRTVEIRQNVISGQTFKMGDQYRPGIYFIEMIQGSNRNQLKLIKQPD